MNSYWLKARRPFLIAVSILLCQAALAYFISHSITDAVLRRDATITRQLLQDDAPAGQTAGPAFSEYGRRMVNIPGVVRANVYSPDGFIRYSSDNNLVGIKFKDNRQLEHALAGETQIAIESVEHDPKNDHVALGALGGADAELIEAYLPLADAAGRTLAVVEYYKTPDDVKQVTGPTRRRVWLASAVASVVMILLVLAFLRRSSAPTSTGSGG